MRFIKKGFACVECLEGSPGNSDAIELDPSSAPKHWVLTADGESHAVEFNDAAYTATISSGEACEACGKREARKGSGLFLTWSLWTDWDI